MKDKARARELAVVITTVARAMGKPTTAVMTAMEEPLGHAVGNALEVAESVECLRGSGVRDLMEVTFAVGEQMLILAGAAKGAADARAMLERSISSGAALGKFRDLVAAQGGDVRVADDPGRLPQAKLRKALASPRSGFVTDVDAMGVALAALRLGAGRARAEDKVDHAVGVDRLVKVGDPVKAGAPLCRIHARSAGAAKEASGMLLEAITVGDERREPARLVDEIIGA